MLTHVSALLAACLALAPLLAFAFFGDSLAPKVQRLRPWQQILLPSLLCLSYALTAYSFHVFRIGWFLLYLLLPAAVAALLLDARRADPEQRVSWRDFLVLGALGLAVDLRWFEHAWPPHLSAISKIVLLDIGIYGFLSLRHLSGVGFDLRLRLRDWGIGLREFLFYTPVAIALGLGLSFLHVHALWPRPLQLAGAFVFTFFLIAIPEELFFRGWLPNLLTRRFGQIPALLVTAVLFGLAHFNKRAAHFNWRYVLLAAIAGIFYGRAWRQDRRVAASAITHTCVDTVWSMWLR
jgi:membrane protease YdiL (CAAX protease family)